MGQAWPQALWQVFPWPGETGSAQEINAAIGYGLIVRVRTFDLRSTEHVAAAGLGVLLVGLASARLFGRFNGGGASRKG